MSSLAYSGEDTFVLVMIGVLLSSNSRQENLWVRKSEAWLKVKANLEQLDFSKISINKIELLGRGAVDFVKDVDSILNKCTKTSLRRSRSLNHR